MPKTHSESQREYARRTNYEANKRYDKKNTKTFTISFVKSTEADILAQINAQENKNGYIKRLIREDIANNSPKTDA